MEVQISCKPGLGVKRGKRSPFLEELPWLGHWAPRCKFICEKQWNTFFNPTRLFVRLVQLFNSKFQDFHLEVLHIQSVSGYRAKHQPVTKVTTKYRLWALSIQQKSPVQIFGIFAARMERVRPLPRIRGHVLCNTGHAGWNFVVFENGALF